MSDHATFTILEFKQLCVLSKIFSVITINILLLKIMILINQTQVWGAGVSHMHHTARVQYTQLSLLIEQKHTYQMFKCSFLFQYTSKHVTQTAGV